MLGLSNDEFALLVICLNHTYSPSGDGVYKYLARLRQQVQVAIRVLINTHRDNFVRLILLLSQPASH